MKKTISSFLLFALLLIVFVGSAESVDYSGESVHILYFYEDACSECNSFKFTLDILEQKYGESITVSRVDVFTKDGWDLYASYGLSKVPSMVIDDSVYQYDPAVFTKASVEDIIDFLLIGKSADHQLRYTMEKQAHIDAVKLLEIVGAIAPWMQSISSYQLAQETFGILPAYDGYMNSLFLPQCIAPSEHYSKKRITNDEFERLMRYSYEAIGYKQGYTIVLDGYVQTIMQFDMDKAEQAFQTFVIDGLMADDSATIEMLEYQQLGDRMAAVKITDTRDTVYSISFTKRDIWITLQTMNANVDTMYAYAESIAAMI